LPASYADALRARDTALAEISEVGVEAEIAEIAEEAEIAEITEEAESAEIAEIVFLKTVLF
jgi:hypothetical protein